MDIVTTLVKSTFSWKDLISSTGSATKASVSVILVLLYGYLSRKYKFLSRKTEDVSAGTRTVNPLAELPTSPRCVPDSKYPAFVLRSSCLRFSSVRSVLLPRQRTSHRASVLKRSFPPVRLTNMLEHHASDWIIIVVSLVFQLVSLAFGLVGWKLFKMPQWIV